MRLKNTSRYPDSEVRALVEFGMRGVKTAGLAVHVKNASCAYRGMAYHGVPSCSPRAKQKSVSRLVTIGVGPAAKFPADNMVTRYVSRGTVPPDFEVPEGWSATLYYRNGEPSHMTLREPVRHPYGGKRAPLITVHNWQEALVMVAAHEARHIWQFTHGKRVSEVDCERFAAKRLEEYRQQMPAAASAKANMHRDFPEF